MARQVVLTVWFLTLLFELVDLTWCRQHLLEIPSTFSVMESTREGGESLAAWAQGDSWKPADSSEPQGLSSSKTSCTWDFRETDVGTCSSACQQACKTLYDWLTLPKALTWQSSAIKNHIVHNLNCSDFIRGIQQTLTVSSTQRVCRCRCQAFPPSLYPKHIYCNRKTSPTSMEVTAASICSYTWSESSGARNTWRFTSKNQILREWKRYGWSSN